MAAYTHQSPVKHSPFSRFPLRLPHRVQLARRTFQLRDVDNVLLRQDSELDVFDLLGSIVRNEFLHHDCEWREKATRDN